MDRMTQDLSTRLAAVFATFAYVRLAILYGSASHGREHPASDVDVAVAADAPLSLPQRVELTLAVQEVVHREVDLVDLRAAHGVLLDEILDRGKILLKRDTRLYAELMIRRMGERADFRPQYDFILATRRKRFLHG